jgi:hypothetical protein
MDRKQDKFAKLRKWLTLPILASAIVISREPVTSHGEALVSSHLFVVRL